MLKSSQKTLHFNSSTSAFSDLFTVTSNLSHTDLYKDDSQLNFPFNSPNSSSSFFLSDSFVSFHGTFSPAEKPV